MLCSSSPEQCIPSLSCSLPVIEHTQLICTHTYIHIYIYIFLRTNLVGAGRLWEILHLIFSELDNLHWRNCCKSFIPSSTHTCFGSFQAPKLLHAERGLQSCKPVLFHYCIFKEIDSCCWVVVFNLTQGCCGTWGMMYVSWMGKDILEELRNVWWALGVVAKC